MVKGEKERGKENRMKTVKNVTPLRQTCLFCTEESDSIKQKRMRDG